MIKANLQILERHGTVRSRTAPFKFGNGAIKQTTEYWLSKAQSLRLMTLLKTEAAMAQTDKMIAVYEAWESGRLHVEFPNLRADRLTSSCCASGIEVLSVPSRRPLAVR